MRYFDSDREMAINHVRVQIAMTTGTRKKALPESSQLLVVYFSLSVVKLVDAASLVISEVPGPIQFYRQLDDETQAGFKLFCTASDVVGTSLWSCCPVYSSRRFWFPWRLSLFSRAFVASTLAARNYECRAVMTTWQI